MNVNRVVEKQHATVTGHPIGRTILLMAAWAVLLLGLAGCNQPANPSTSGQTTVTQTTTAQTTQIQTSASQTTIQTTSNPTTTGSQIASATRFSMADLTINGIAVGATPQEARQVLGAPKESKTDIDPVSGLDVLTDTYDGLKLSFLKGAKGDTNFRLQYAEVTGRQYVLTRGIKVGDTASNVYPLFYHDKNTADYKGFTVLYGDPDLLDGEKTTGDITFAYYNEQEALFLSMKPPYMTGSATIYDEMAVLRLTIENRIITKAFWMLGAGAE